MKPSNPEDQRLKDLVVAPLVGRHAHQGRNHHAAIWYYSAVYSVPPAQNNVGIQDPDQGQRGVFAIRGNKI